MLGPKQLQPKDMAKFMEEHVEQLRNEGLFPAEQPTAPTLPQIMKAHAEVWREIEGSLEYLSDVQRDGGDIELANFVGRQSAFAQLVAEIYVRKAEESG